MKLSELAKATGAQVEGATEDVEIVGAAGLDEAGEGHVTFLANPRYTPRVNTTRASAIYLSEEAKTDRQIAILRVKDPYLAYTRALRIFNPEAELEPFIHPSAVIDPTARIAARVAIGACSVIGRNAFIGDDVYIHADDLPAQGQDRLRVAVTALLGRAAGGVALDDEDLGQRRVAHRAVGELAGEGGVLQRRLAPGQVAGLARRVTGARGVDGLADHHARLCRVLLEELGETLVDSRLHEALDGRVAELGLGLALELRLADLHRDDRGEPLAYVLALEVGVLLLELADLARVLVDRAGERRAEAGQVRAALVRVDVVCEREQRLLVGVVPLERDLDLADLLRVLDEDHGRVQRLARALAVQVLDEVDDAALVLEARLEALAALVGEVDLEAPRQEGHLAEALLEHRAVVLDRLEDLEVGQERDARAAAVGLGALGRSAVGVPRL